MRSTLAIVCALLPTLALAQADGGTAFTLIAPDVVVSPERIARPKTDVPSSVTVLGPEDVAQAPAATFDNLVRTVPSATTFRRTSSLVSDPTAQGLSLRGLGSSGISRALVLVDGVPLNDPFGGWVYWDSLSMLDVERVEIAPTGASALYGDFALGGVAQVFSRPLERGVQAELSGGTLDTFGAAARLADRHGPLAGAVFGEYLGTGGYPVVAANERGAVDVSAGSRHGVIGAHASLDASPRLWLGLDGRFFDEDQNGGTTFTRSQVRAGLYALSARYDAGAIGRLDARLFGTDEVFEQDRARIASDRSVEAEAAAQTVPSSSQGASLSWTSPELGASVHQVLVAGVDALHVHGFSSERLYPPTVTSRSLIGRVAGGDQTFAGLYAQDAVRLGAWELDLASRVDLWRNTSGHLTQTSASGARTTDFASTSGTEWNPKFALLHHTTDWLTLHAAAYRSFRAPTLNELYRPFQVGTVLTDANPALRPERAWGGELGPMFEAKNFSASLTGFWNVLDRPITNVTLASPLPDGAQRERENLGQARARGVELSTAIAPTPRWSFGASYVFVEPIVTAAPDHPELLGKELAQDPEHRATVWTRFTGGLLDALVQLRINGPQFEDDLNTLPMSGFVVVDARVSRSLGGGLELFAVAENLLDRTYLVGRAGIDTIGQPRTLRLGIRLTR